MEIKPFAKKVYLSSPTMHGEELQFMKEAFDTNWMSTVGKNIDEVESLICQRVAVNMLLLCPQVPLLCIWL